MKSVLISIQPKWCELIVSGKKTVEVRKTKPKLETPFKCYIYCTNGGKDVFYRSDYSYDDILYTPKHKAECKKRLEENGHKVYNGKVIGEFVCDKLYMIRYSCGSYRCDGLTRIENDRLASASRLSLSDMRNYLLCENGYAWHITNLVIYERPKELSEFNHCGVNYHFNPPITKPPQSWCYVEEVST